MKENSLFRIECFLLVLGLVNICYGLPAFVNEDCISDCEENNLFDYIKYVDLIGMTDANMVRKIQAHLMEKILDRNVNPCDDFYEYVCGNWAAVNELEKGSDFSNYKLLRDRNRKAILELLEEEVNDNDSEVIKKMKNFFISCMDEEAIMARGVAEPILEVLKIFGPWPALDENWSADNFDWLNLTAHLNLYDIQSVIKVDPKLDLMAVYAHELTKIWTESMSMLLQELGVNSSYQAKLYEMVAEFDGQLLDITSIERVEPQLITIKELNKKTKGIKWEQYLTTVEAIEYGENTKIAVEWLEYFVELAKLMSNTNAETFMNFAFLKIIQKAMSFIAVENHSIYCRVRSIDVFSSVLSLMFTKKYVPDYVRADVTEIILDIRAASKDALLNSAWLDENSKKAAIKKLEVSPFEIGYIDRIPIEKLDKLYENVHIDPKKYFENEFSILKSEIKIQSLMGRSFSYDVNAFFQQTNKGKMMLNAGILLPPFYHKLFPQVIKYGAIGMTIGHEMMHGFDVDGIQYDADGNINVWFDENLKFSYAVRAACFREQYKKYKLPALNLYLNPDNTIGENIADGEGLELAYRAYKKWTTDNKELAESELEHYQQLNMTADQLFFIAFAQAECAEQSEAQLMFLIESDPHTPTLFRVIGSVSNSQSFTDAFQCPLGSPMNPTRKCQYLRQ